MNKNMFTKNKNLISEKKQCTQCFKVGKNSFDFQQENLQLIISKGKYPSRYSDIKCAGLRLLLNAKGSVGYYFTSTINGKAYGKAIGSVYSTTVEEARKIVQNIKDNLDEFYSTKIKERYLVDNFAKYGYFPRKKSTPVKGTETILSDENASLKEKIKDLQAEIEKLSQEIEKLRDSNIALGSRLSTIRRIACYDTEDVD